MFLESSDPEFDDYNSHFSALEQSTEKLLKDTKAYIEAVTGMHPLPTFPSTINLDPPFLSSLDQC